MSEALSREDEAFVAGLRQRRESVVVRGTIVAVGAFAFEPIIGSLTSLIWASTFLGVQLFEAWLTGPYRRPDPKPMGTGARILAVLCLFLSNTVYCSVALMMWGHGLPGGACAMLILAGAAVSAVMNTAGSRTILAANLAPAAAFFALSPWLLQQAGGDPKAVLTLSLACVIFAGFVLATYNQTQVMAEAERRARRTAEHRRSELEGAAASKTTFIASVGHDLRTPLSAILTGATEIRRTASDAADRSNAELILDAGEMMNRLLDDLLDHSRLEAGRMEIEPVVFNLRDLIARASRFWQGQARAKGVRLAVEGGRFLPDWVEADPVRVRQILNNLLSNAVKFTDKGEVRVRLNAWPAEDGRHALVIEVADTGQGMDAEQQKRLFNAFDQTRSGVARSHGGSGLGMWISRGLAQLMGGRLTVRSQKGEGTTFTLALVIDGAEAPILMPVQPEVDRVGAGFAPLTPVFRADETEPSVVSEPVEVASSDVPGADEDERPLRVLVVDDHDINRRAVQLILAPLGCDIAQAADGRAALAAAEAQPFDVIFMDVRMPELDGRETTRRLRAVAGPNQSTPVIAVTADTAPEDVRACAEAGMTWFVGKPLTPAALLGALQGVLSGESRFHHEDVRAA